MRLVFDTTSTTKVTLELHSKEITSVSFLKPYKMQLHVIIDLCQVTNFNYVKPSCCLFLEGCWKEVAG